MATLDDSVPPVPVPPTAAKSTSAAVVPPVEPKPRTRKPAAAAVEAAPAAVAASVAAAPAVSPYSAPAAAAPQPYVPVPAGPPQGLSIGSMVAGIGGIVLGGFILASIAAVVMGHMAQKRQPYAKAFWLTGLITGYIGIGIGLIVALLVVVWFVAIATIASNGYYNY